MILKFFDNNKQYLYFVFRVLVGLLFLQHGFQKLFGLLGGTAAAPWSLIFFAGLIELIGGILIALGFFTRLAALIGGLELIIAYFKVHAPQALAPIVNKGELGLLYIAVFIVIVGYGAGKWSLERLILKKEVF